MHQSVSSARSWAIAGLAFFLTVSVLSIGYATLSSGLSVGDKVGAGSGLTASAWNKIIDSIVELDGRTTNISSSAANTGLGVPNPLEKLEVSGNIKTSGGVIGTAFGESFISIMPNNMSFGGGGSVNGSSTAAMPVGTYFYQIYACAGQNNFSAGATGDFVFVSGSGSSTPMNYFDNINIGGGSCGYFRSGYIQVSAPNSAVQFRINSYGGWSNTDNNPAANSVTAGIWKIF